MVLIQYMISVTNLRSGTIYKEAGQPYLVLKYQHTKVGRGNASIKVKVRHLLTGAVSERTFVSGAAVEEADVEKVKMQYLYRDAGNAHFMNMSNFEQRALPLTLVEEDLPYLKEGLEVYLFLFEGKPSSVEMPLNVALKVTATEPGFKGDSATTVLKPAVLETGLKLNVPLFVKVGDTVKVDTRTGEYVGRI